MIDFYKDKEGYDVYRYEDLQEDKMVYCAECGNEVILELKPSGDFYYFCSKCGRKVTIKKEWRKV